MTAVSVCRARATLFAALAWLACAAAADPFTPGNLVVYRVGAGTGNLMVAGNPVFLDEFTPAGAFVQSIAMPTTASGAQRQLIASGTAVTDGLLTRSVDGTCLVVPGYGRNIGGSGSVATTPSTTVPRVIGRVTAAGAVDTSTALTDAANGGNFRGAASTDCVSLWVSGSIGGVRYTTLGSTSSNDLTSVVQPDVRGVAIYGGQLFASWMNATTSSKGVGTVDGGLPTIGAQPVARLPGLTDANFPNTYQFYFTPGMDVLYIADGGSGALSKFSLVSGSWVSNGSAGASADAYRGLTGAVIDGKVTLFATRKGGSTASGGGELVKVVDANGYNAPFSGTITFLAAAATNTAFRGVAFAPAITFTLTPSAGANGGISPSTPQVVFAGATRDFTVTADAGYSVAMGGSCGGTLAGNTYTTAPASHNCTVEATFALITRTVTPSAGAHGSISPSAPQVVPRGGTATFQVVPDTGYSASVDGSCGGALSGTTYTTDPVTTDCTVSATFTLVTRTVTPSAGANGTITPDSAQIIALGTTASFTVAAAFGYSISVGGTCGGSLSGAVFTTNAVTADCTVEATFPPLPRYTVTPTASPNGTISPATPQTVISGQAAAFTIAALPGYSTAIRGSCGGSLAGDTFTTNAVTRDCTVAVTFARKLVLFVGNSYTFGRVDPVMSYNSGNVNDLTHQMWIANPTGSNDDEPHPWGGIPGIFKKLTDQAGLDYDVSISARNAASLRGHYLNSNPAGWDLRGNIASQKWDTVVLQDLSDEPLPANRGANANLPYFNAYVDKIEAWIHGGAAESYTETQLFGNGSDTTCSSITGASVNACNTLRIVSPANANAHAQTDVFLYQTWARPDMIGPNGTNGPTAGTHYYTAAEGLEAMTADFHNAYFGRAAANAGIHGVSPVGDAFLRAVLDGVAMRDPYVPEAGKINLWHTDYFHPSKYGSYLSALVHFATITGLDPMTLGPSEQAAADLGISPAIAAQLQRVARATVMPDATPPMTSAGVSTAANGNGWNKTPVTVTLFATDNAGGWGVDSISYSLSGAQSGSGTVPNGGTVTISAEGQTTLTYFATDVAGNAESARTLVLRIDLTAPTLSVPADFSVDATGPGGASVTYDVTGSDTSGIAPAIACLPVSGSTLPIGASTISCTATDAADNSASATFNVSVLALVTVAPSAGAHGTISPDSAQIIHLGTTSSFQVAPAAGYSASVGGSCGGILSGTTYTTNPVMADCTVAATFTLITRTVAPSSGANGTISPDSAQIVPLGTTASFNVAAAIGYSASVGGSCGGTLTGGTYTTNPVTADCTVAAAFTPLPTYTATPVAGAHGTVTPATARTVTSGQTTSFTLVPASGYNMAIRGTCGGGLTGDTYTTHPVTHDCTVLVVFARKLVLFVGNSDTTGRVDPVASYNSTHVTDLTHEMSIANSTGANADEPHPWGGIPGIFKRLADQAGLDYDVSISARSAETLRGHYLNTNPAAWDLRGNIASQKWNAVILQDLGDEPLPANRGAHANLPDFNTYVDAIEASIHGGANALAEVFLYQTWARPDMIGPNGTSGPAPDAHYYTAAEGLEAMTADLHAAYFGRATGNPRIEDVSAVGDAFLRAVREGVAMRDPYVPEAGKINLWHTDYFHPSKYGSYLSALVHLATIAGIDPMSLGSGEQAAAELGIPAPIAAQLQRIARTTVMPDTTPPMTTATVSAAPNANGWNNSPVTVTFAATDNPGGWGVSFVTYSLAGAQSGGDSVPRGGAVMISAEGETTLTYFATDVAGNAEARRTLRIAIDKSAPVISGVPGTSCSLWPPNHKMVTVATISASGGVSPLASLSVAVTSNEPAAAGESDITISGSGTGPRTVSLRAEREGKGSGRIYTFNVSATDQAGNSASTTGRCVVPHDQGH